MPHGDQQRVDSVDDGCLTPLIHSVCPGMAEVLAQVRSVAPTRATVLLTGETGVGKGLFAKLIHYWSNRRHEPFVSVHCGAMPDTLLESELFGHERGSFTGAVQRRHGEFELAHRGTLFLDEVGTISPAAQIKLLDVLQQRRFHRVGGEREVAVDVRIVAATNCDLGELQRSGLFRADLYHRLNVFPIAVPPLRERTEEIPWLVRDLLARLNRIYGKSIDGVDPRVMRAFQAWDWPGNVRELENLLERALILETTGCIAPARIPREILAAGESHPPASASVASTLAAARREAVEAAERRYLTALLAQHEGRMSPAARTAAVGTRQLRKLLRRHGIRRDEFRPPAPGSPSR